MAVSKSVLETVRKTWSSIIGFGGLDTTILSGMTVEKHHLNRVNGLHGGTLCTLVDIGGSLAVSAKTNSTYTGVSTDINVSFLNAGKIGDQLQIESVCHKSGKTLAYTNVTVKSGDKILVTGSHTKYVGQKDQWRDVSK
ncbi:hypothetical protein HDU85_006981 [Gaertneriomyces sp. JEL0708]|nr:hypothetical protein HDU85_006981 [Gaertneriomyces sp. JEL0708]